MPHPTTISRVYDWASRSRQPFFQVRDVTMGMMITRPVASSALDALEEMGLAEQTEGGWRILGSADELAAALDAQQRQQQDREQTPLKPFEAARDVFDYAARCAQQEQ